MYNFKKFFTYLVVGALIFGLILSCKNNDKTGTETTDTETTDTKTPDDKKPEDSSSSGTFKVSSIVGTWSAATAESQVKTFTVSTDGKISMTVVGQQVTLTIDTWTADKDKEVEQYQKTISTTVMFMQVPFTFTFKSANSCHLSAEVSMGGQKYVIEEEFTK